MDKIGFGFEHYDAFGRWRDNDRGYPIDATGTIVQANATDGDVGFDGVSALEAYLAHNDDVKRCMVRYWSFYAYGSTSLGFRTPAPIRRSATRRRRPGSGCAARWWPQSLHASHFTRRVQAQ